MKMTKFGIPAKTNQKLIKQVHNGRLRARVIERVSYPLTVPEWRNMVLATGGICHNCGEDVGIDHFELDHIIPMCVGGEHSIENVQPICKPCNRAKSSYLADGTKPPLRQWDAILIARRKERTS